MLNRVSPFWITHEPQAPKYIKFPPLDILEHRYTIVA